MATRSARDRAPWWTAPAAVLGALLIRALGHTWRLESPAAQRAVDRAHRESGRVIYAFWHGRMFPLVFTHRGRGVGVLISRHRDGELIARIVEHLGFHTARGSSTRGGEAGVLEMLAFAETGRALAISPDGPRGPARRVKPGLVFLAARTGWPVVPVTSAANSAWVFRSWDRFRVPRPFARVRVTYGEPIAVRLDEADEEQWRSRIEAEIDAITARAAAEVGEPA